jgi:hypothetical protein
MFELAVKFGTEQQDIARQIGPGEKCDDPAIDP